MQFAWAYPRAGALNWADGGPAVCAMVSKASEPLGTFLHLEDALFEVVVVGHPLVPNGGDGGQFGLEFAAFN